MLRVGLILNLDLGWFGDEFPVTACVEYRKGTLIGKSGRDIPLGYRDATLDSSKSVPGYKRKSGPCCGHVRSSLKTRHQKLNVWAWPVFVDT